jgi:hypothetical protein
MAAIAHVFTIGYVAELLGADEEWLHELSIDMFPEHGCLRVYTTKDEAITAFTDESRPEQAERNDRRPLLTLDPSRRGCRLRRHCRLAWRWSRPEKAGPSVPASRNCHNKSVQIARSLQTC